MGCHPIWIVHRKMTSRKEAQKRKKQDEFFHNTSLKIIVFPIQREMHFLKIRFGLCHVLILDLPVLYDDHKIPPLFLYDPPAL